MTLVKIASWPKWCIRRTLFNIHTVKEMTPRATKNQLTDIGHRYFQQVMTMKKTAGAVKVTIQNEYRTNGLSTIILFVHMAATHEVTNIMADATKKTTSVSFLKCSFIVLPLG